jgi:hypothetical protein
MLHLYMRSSEKHSLATTTTTGPKYSSRLRHTHTHIYIYSYFIYKYIYIYICVWIHRSRSFFFSVSPPSLLTFLFNQYIYIDNEKHIHKFISLEEATIQYFASSPSTKACHSNVCWCLVSFKYTLVSIKNNNKNNNNIAYSLVYIHMCKEFIQDEVRIIIIMQFWSKRLL